MRIGIGTTVWTRSFLSGHKDGIGVYTEQLWEQLSNTVSRAVPYAFGVPSAVKYDKRAPAALECIDGSYVKQTAYSLLLNQPFRRTQHLAEQIDVFHATDHHIPRLQGVPVVATIMDAIPFVHPEWASSRLRWLKNAAFKRASKWAQHVITISEFSKGDIINAFGVDEADITVIPLGYDESLLQRIDDAQRQAVLARYGLAGNFFIFVGTLQPRKNVRRVIAAHRALSADIQAAHPLVIVGHYGWGDEDLLRDIEKMEKNNQGRWLRGVPHGDLLALMQSATALVYPSLYEGFGLPVLEGFAADIPVISSNTTSIPEVAGDAALLVNPLDTDEIAHAMLNVVENNELASELVRRGKLRLDQFSWQSCADSTLDVYKKVI